jgi:hypothetical protein
MLFLTPPHADKAQTGPLPPEFYSVEFPLGHIQPLYQFKLWRSDQNTFFLLVKESSGLISRLKVGHIIPMKYYSEDAMHSAEVYNTQVIEIVKETKGRFSGHYRIELDIVLDGQNESPVSDNNNI